ncbi:MAG: IS66 family transposase [Alphaproteobacteria bacterium]|nr:IS66 family transposase [Alphaproteobacteria bacterium]MDE2493940.1 IS66 family transposase [Alphaproteobacteria bacterium]
MSTPADYSILTSAEKDALIATLLSRLDAMDKRIAALEAENAALRARLNLPPKTPDNSSTPPSHGHKPSGEASNKPKGQVHAGAHRPLHPNPTSKREVMATQCQHCTADVSGVVQTAVQSYDRIEIPEIKPDVTRVTLQGGICPCCAKRFKAAPPQGLEPGSPFGPNLRAFAIYLRASHAVSFERLARLMSDLLGLQISEGALVNILDDSRKAFAEQTSLIRARLLCGSTLQSDETGMRVGKRTWWTWVFHHDKDCCFIAAPSRGKTVVEAFLGGTRPDYWVSDRLAAQMGWATKEHQVCLAHLLRDVQYAIDAGDNLFAPPLAKLLRRACAIGRRREKLADATLRSYAVKLDNRLNELLRIAPQGNEGEKLQRMIKKWRLHLFVFVTNRNLPPTNNGSERAIRPCVIFRKVTNCFRSEWGAKLYADIRSVLETARRRAIDPLTAIRLTLNGMPLTEGA